MKLIRMIILIVICLYLGAYIGKEKLNESARVSYVWVKDILNLDNTEQEK